MKKTYLIALLILICPEIYCQQALVSPDTKTDWWGDIDGFLNQQARISLATAGEVLKDNPPSTIENRERKMALLLIDNVLHEEKAPYRPAVQAFFRSRIAAAVNEIRSTKVNQGAVIWKLYNHTFVIKTQSVTVGFDIQRGMLSIPGFTLDRQLIESLADAVDILFISHMHADHNEEIVAEIFLAKNKPVVAPEGIFQGSPVYSAIQHLPRSAETVHTIALPEKGLSLRALVFPGHQGATLLNNVYLVFSPEGYSFAHTGDQSNEKDFEWIGNIGKDHKVDILMTNSWSYYPGLRTAKGFHPELMISGHENELGHTIDHREPYWLNPLRMGDGKLYPWIEMAWGEKYHYYRAGNN